MSTNSNFMPTVGSPVLLTRRGHNELYCYDAVVERITKTGMVVVSYGDPKTEKRYYKPKWGGEWREHGESMYGSYRWAVFFDKDIGPERERTAAVLAEQKVLNDVRHALARLSQQTRVDHYHPPTLTELKTLRERMIALSYAVTAAETWRANNPEPSADVVGATIGEE